jgi:putative spermidine/putrescine transport system permease protein
MSGRLGRGVVWLLAILYFFGPFAAAILFTFHVPGTSGWNASAYSEIFHTGGNGQLGIGSALVFSLLLSLATIVLTLLVMVPTQLLLHLRLSRLRPVVEVICLLPLVFPPIVLAAGVQDLYGWAGPKGSATHGNAIFGFLVWIRDQGHPLLLCVLYMVMTLPFVYRTIDAGISAMDVRTLTEASRSLGASWVTTVRSVVVPGLRTSLVNAGFLVFALCMGEFTVAITLGYLKPFPVWLATLPTNSGQTQAAISTLALVVVEVLMLILVFGMAVAGRRKGRDDTPMVVTGPASAAGVIPAAEALNDKKVDA